MNRKPKIQGRVLTVDISLPLRRSELLFYSKRYGPNFERPKRKRGRILFPSWIPHEPVMG
jgi:hypothetical protein